MQRLETSLQKIAPALTARNPREVDRLTDDALTELGRVAAKKAPRGEGTVFDENMTALMRSLRRTEELAAIRSWDDAAREHTTALSVLEAMKARPIQAANVAAANKLSGLSTYSLGVDYPRGLEGKIASFLTGEDPSMPVAAQVSAANVKLGRPGVKGARRKKTRKSLRKRRTTRRG